jgi:hypothetical protein
MTSDKVLEVIQVYRKKFESMRYQKIECPHNKKVEQHEPWVALNHCYNMLETMEGFVREGRMDKVFRWLGFVQGVLWVNGVYSLEELKNHSKPSA